MAGAQSLISNAFYVRLLAPRLPAVSLGELTLGDVSAALPSHPARGAVRRVPACPGGLGGPRLFIPSRWKPGPLRVAHRPQMQSAGCTGTKLLSNIPLCSDTCVTLEFWLLKPFWVLHIKHLCLTVCSVCLAAVLHRRDAGECLLRLGPAEAALGHHEAGGPGGEAGGGKAAPSPSGRGRNLVPAASGGLGASFPLEETLINSSGSFLGAAKR